MPLHVSLLGGFSVRRPDGAPLSLPTRKAQGLLAYLTCLAGEPQARDRLAGLLWGESGEEQARHSLSQTLTALRQLTSGAGDWLLTSRETVCVRAGALKSDVAELQELASRADEPSLARAVDLYRGPLLDGCSLTESAFEEWLGAERARLHRLALRAALRLAEVRSERDDADGALAALQAALAIDPSAEEIHRKLMTQHLSAGEFNEAIRRYRDCREALQRELGTQPEPSTSALYREAVRLLASSRDEIEVPEQQPAAGGRASIAVMPFTDEPGTAGAQAGIARGLVHDVITRLAKLRSLHVIAQGTVFALSERGVDPAEAGKRLRVDYVASGSVRSSGSRVRVQVELVDTRTARIVWTEVFDRRLDATLEVLEEIGNQLVASLAGEIEAAERRRAVLKAPSSLTAWEAHHRGLWHMYRFNAADNDRAQDYFRQAVRQDPTFSGAYAGLSFTHWQNAFLLRPAERERESAQALEMAGESLNADHYDPAAHLAMGRALWLRGEESQSLQELQAAVELSPNFALGHYMLGFVHCQSGDADIAIEAAQRSRSLSPYDPLKFGMLASRGLAHLRRGELDAAADWAVKATTCPNAHAHILAIAAHCLALAGRLEEGRAFLQQIRVSAPEYGVRDLLGSFRFAEPMQSLLLDAGRRIGSA